MVKAVLNNTVLAESPDTVIVEGNHYFPPESVNRDLFKDSKTSTVCPWKGTASYYDAVVGETTVKDAAWYYPDPSQKASNIKDYVAFYPNKVQIA